jgi:NAD(P)-dependent dehydrogenase (short-subunit alcohol dehydrogenase family)
LPVNLLAAPLSVLLSGKYKKEEAMSFLNLEGKVAIVTGGGAGIGRAIALGFAREGARVAVVDWKAEDGQAVVAEIEKLDENKPLDDLTATFIHADVSKDADASRIAAEAIAAFGRIDILCNNAGIQTYGTVESTAEEIWDKTLGVNLKSIYLVSKYVIPHMKQAGGGSIVNTASVQSVAALANSAAYVASKGGVTSLTQEMALDFGRYNIRVNAVLPGSIRTPMLEYSASQTPDPQKAMEEWNKLYALGRIGEAVEVANLILFLASPAASFITGAPYLVDGGLVARLF